MPLLGHVRDFRLEEALRDFGKNFIVLFDDNDVGTIGSDSVALRRRCFGVAEFHSAKVGERHNCTIGEREILDDPLGVLPAKWVRRADVCLRNLISG